MHYFNYTTGLTHIVDFGRAFDCALPVHKTLRVFEMSVRQMFLQCMVGGSGVPIIIEFDCDGFYPNPCLQEWTQANPLGVVPATAHNDRGSR